MKQITLNQIIKQVNNLKRKNETPEYLIVGKNQYKEIKNWTGKPAQMKNDENFINDEMFGLLIIKLNKINDYFEIQ